jgi:hypothetical protein
VNLHDGSGPTIRSFERLVTAGTDVSIQTGFAIAEDGARRVARCFAKCVVQPLSISCRDQKLGIDRPKTFGVRVLNFRSLIL